MITTLERKGKSLITCINIVLDAEKKLNELMEILQQQFR
ncbi:Uncharacterized protein FWK35_00000649, partial [Aphis craccivora]